MRSSFHLVVLAALLASSGCTHMALERRTVKQASTLTDLQSRQVLDNLAMFSCNKEAVAWHVKLRGGTVQIADQGSGGFTADIAAAAGGEVTRLIPSGGAQRGVLNQWDVQPVVDTEELEFLQHAYQRAIYPGDREVVVNIYKAICELAISNRVVPHSEITLKAIEKLKEAATGEDLKAIEQAERRIKGYYAKIKLVTENLPPPGDDIAALKVKQKEHQDRLEYWRVQILLELPRVCGSRFVPTYDEQKIERNIAIAEQAKAKIVKLSELADDKFNSPWLCVGTKHDTPKGACLVGHYCNCHIWVMPDQQQMFREFMLIVLTLVPSDVTQDIRGPAYSPAIGSR